jgi:hypothetical protein
MAVTFWENLGGNVRGGASKRLLFRGTAVGRSERKSKNASFSALPVPYKFVKFGAL